MATTTDTNSMPKESAFSVGFIPSVYHKRVLHPWSVHQSPTTKKFVATIEFPHCRSEKQHTQYLFDAEREARQFCKSFSPPKLQKAADVCMLCDTTSNNNNNNKKNKANHCRNCGAHVCEACTRRWTVNMVPRTYVQMESQLSTYIRACKSCDWLSNAFCMALLQGRKDDAMMLFGTGNVNLRTTFAGIHGEAMFPIHCAVLGGSIDLVRWLHESQMCNVLSRSKKSVQTSAHRTLIDLAMTGKNPLETLQYLIGKCGISIHDVKDSSLAPKILEYFLKDASHQNRQSPATVIPSLLLEDEEDISSYAAAEDLCTLCCERSCGDAVLVPCGHQVCCTDCGAHLQQCPICKAPCSVMRIFRP